MKTAIFNERLEIKNKSVKEIILYALSFIIVPIASILIICAGKESP